MRRSKTPPRLQLSVHLELALDEKLRVGATLGCAHLYDDSHGFTSWGAGLLRGLRNPWAGSDESIGSQCSSAAAAFLAGRTFPHKGTSTLVMMGMSSSP